VRHPLVRGAAVTIGCVVSWRFVLAVPLPIPYRDQAAAWELQHQTFHGLLWLLAGPPLDAISVGALGLTPFLLAFVILWGVWALTGQMRTRWEDPRLKYQDLFWGTAAFAAIGAFGRVKILVGGHPRILASTPGLVSMILLILGTLSMFALGLVISRWGLPQGDGVWFLFAVQTVLAGVRHLGRVFDVGPVNQQLLIAVGLYLLISLVLLAGTIAVIWAFRVIPTLEQSGHHVGQRRSFTVSLIQGSLIGSVMWAATFIALPRNFAAGFHLSAADIDRYWSSTSSLTYVSIAYNGVFFVLVVLLTLGAMYLNFNPGYVVEQLRRRGGRVAPPYPISPTRYLWRLALTVNAAGGLWLATVVVVAPLISRPVLGFGLSAGGFPFVISSAILASSAQRVRDRL
jgi:preprotein translocase subunit SecY